MGNTTNVLELLQAILERQGTGPGTASLEVVPALVDDLSSHRELIESAIRHAGGVLLDAEACADGTQGKLDQTLRTVLTTALRVRKAGGGWLSLRITQEKSIVRARVKESDPNALVSQGIRTILGIAASLFDRRLQETTFAAITYDESGLDDDWADAVWRLFSDQLTGMQLGGIRTLLLLVETPRVRYQRHCKAGVSVAFHLGASGLERRKDWATNRAEIHRLCSQEDRLIVLFLGAGFSASSGLPLGDELRDTALRRLLDSADPYEQLVEAFHRYVASNRRLLESEISLSHQAFARSLTLERVLREEIYRNGPARSPTLREFQRRNASATTAQGPAVRSLHDLIRRRCHFVVATVNFDTLVESQGGVRVFAGDDDFLECVDYLRTYRHSGGDVPVLKLHGTIERPETIVATVDEVARGLSVPKTKALDELANPAMPVSWVYIGYSMRDPDVTSLLALRRFAEALDETWVSPFPTPFARRFAEEHRSFTLSPGFWQRSITETADEFLKELALAWRS